MKRALAFLQKHTVAIAILFHSIGILGFVSPYRDQFVLLTPFNLSLTFGLLLLHAKQTLKLWGAIVLAWFIGYTMEVVGVKTGAIFGSYFYGKALGLKMAEVPLMIGVNWAMLLLFTLPIASLFTQNFWLKALVGAAFMTLLDALIEPVAPLLDFWYWQNDTAPLQNFAAWFFIAFALQLIANLLLKNWSNSKAIALYSIQFVFFLLLNVLL